LVGRKRLHQRGNSLYLRTMNHQILKICLFLITSVAVCSCSKESAPKPNIISSYNVIAGPYNLVVDKTGCIYFTNLGDHNILRVSTSGTISSIAGTDTVAGCFGDGGAAKSAYLNSPFGIIMDRTGNIYFSDNSCQRIHEINMSSGIMSLIAGNGNAGYSGDSGLATNAQIYYPFAVTTDTSGNIFFADEGNNRIRKVNSKSGIITTIAGNGILGSGGDGGPATSANLSGPIGIAIDDSGNVYIADQGNARIRKVTALTGVINTIVTGVAPGPVVVDSAQNIYFSQVTFVCRRDHITGNVTIIAGNVRSIGNSGDGGPATAAELNDVCGIALDASGNIYLADNRNNNIRKITASTGTISTVAHN